MIDQEINRTLYKYENLFNLFIKLNNENRMPNKFVISGKKVLVSQLLHTI